jgi:photosystem II stability/assembly factor-like uncharacterized protein
MLDSVIQSFWRQQKALMSTNRRWAMYCWEVAGLLAVLLLGGCATNSPSGSEPPEYLRSEMIKRQPVPAGLTTYPLNGPFGGNIARLARLGQSDTIIAGTYKGEIFRSEDAGSSWTLVSAESHGRINDILSVENLVLAATKEGIFRSSDGGTSWNHITLGDRFHPEVSKILLFQNQLVAATDNGLYRSDRDGQIWTLISSTPFNSTPFNERVDELALDRNILLASDGRTIFGSKDLQLWTPTNQGLNASAVPLDLPFVHLITVSDVPFVLAIGKSKNRIYRKASEGANWTAVAQVESSPYRGLATSGDSLFLITEKTIHISNGGSWHELSLPAHDIKVNDLIQLGSTVLAATEQGMYRGDINTGVWALSSNGLRSSRTAGSLLLTGAFRFAIWDAKLFSGNGGNEGWTDITDQLSSKEGESDRGEPAVFDVNFLGDSLFVTTNQGLFRDKLNGGQPTLAPPPTNTPLAASGWWLGSLVRTDKQLFVSMGARIFRTSNGEAWEEISAGLEKVPRLFSMVEFGRAGDSLFLSASESSDARRWDGESLTQKRSVFRLLAGEKKWVEISTGLQVPVTAFAAAGDTIYAAASGFDDTKSNDTFRPQLLRLERLSDSKWTPVPVNGLDGRVASLWIDPTHPEVIIAGTSRGLFWSNDGGQQFNRSPAQPGTASFSQVSALAYKDGQLFANTDTGVVYIYDQIPRGKWYEGWGEWKNNNLGVFYGSAIVILLLIVLSTRLISVLLQLEVPGIKQIAPTFYLLRFGRWKLYRRYRGRLGKAQGLAEDIKYGVEHYVDLPFEIDDKLIEGKLSEFFTQQPLTRRVVLDADGGRGKSTLCHYLARRGVNQGDLFAGKRLVPVVIDGLTYTGDLLNAISNALKEDHAYVNKTIVASQIAAGNLLVIFDGFSEIRESYLGAASSAELPGFIQQHPDTPFIFTSRSKLPPAVLKALKDTVTIKLRNVDETTARTFLSQYLKHGEQNVDALMSEIKMRFNDLPRIPLMLKLIANVYDEKAKVPKDRATLFADYAEQVLRPDATGIDYPRGLHFAIRHLVRETHLRSGGDRGFTEDRAVDLLSEIKEQLEAREITLSPIKLLLLLTRAGLYKQVGENLKFFHDSFESYFGARALEIDFRDGRHELIKECAGNERLAETWRFLCEILEETGDKQRLEILLQEKSV